MNTDDKIEQGICLAFIVLVSLFAIAAEVRGDDLSDRAAVAIAISNATSNPWLPPVPKPPPKTSRKIVYVYYAPFNCPPCDIQRADLKGFNDDPESPFEIREPKPGEVPYAAQWYPYTLWQNGAGEWVHIPPWRGKKYLIDTWVASQAPKTLCATGKQSLQVRLTTDQLREFARTYAGPLVEIKGKRDDYRSHLLELPNHGFLLNQIQSLTQAECEKLHGAQHNGYITPFQIIKQ